MFDPREALFFSRGYGDAVTQQGSGRIVKGSVEPEHVHVIPPRQTNHTLNRAAPRKRQKMLSTGITREVRPTSATSRGARDVPLRTFREERNIQSQPSGDQRLPNLPAAAKQRRQIAHGRDHHGVIRQRRPRLHLRRYRSGCFL